MCDVADRSELFDAVFTGDSLVPKRRIDAIVFLSLLAGRTRRATLGTACLASFIFRHPIVLANQWRRSTSRARAGGFGTISRPARVSTPQPSPGRA